MKKIVPIILCGGVGTRLWPLSRSRHPKQFLKIFGNFSLFEQTLLRIRSIQEAKSLGFDVLTPIVVTQENQRFLVSSAIKDVDIKADVILEPIGKDTAASLTLAALYAKQNYGDCVTVVLPADHFFDDNKLFVDSIIKAIIQATDYNFSILGTKAIFANTAYGYIKMDNERVVQFIEKPSKKDAETYVSLSYFWNMGIVCTSVAHWLSAIEYYQPIIFENSSLAWQNKTVDGDFIRPCKDYFNKIPKNSIDYAVLENCSQDNRFTLCMSEYKGIWSDLGSWDSVLDMFCDEEGNAFLAEVVSQETKNSLAYSHKPVVMLGVENVVVIDTPDVLLVCDKSKTQLIKQMTDEVKKINPRLLDDHRKAYRPWGWYDITDESERFKVKRIHVNPKSSLSLQKHYHRAEHWVVVKGTALVECDKKEVLVSENQSIYIPLGSIHRLSNPGIIPLEMIEVQSGSYLEEDDIVRFDDFYGRQ